MSGRIERTVRFVSAKADTRPVLYWRTRPFEERLAETMALHREGNELFLGGNPAFVFQIKVRHVDGS